MQKRLRESLLGIGEIKSNHNFLKNDTLILLTNCFPYGKGESFLELEIEHLKRDFERIIILPSICENDRRELPNSIEVNTSIQSIHISNLEVLRFYCSRLWFWSELVTILLSKNFKKNFFSFHTFCKLSLKKFKALENFLINENIEKSKLVIYSYWWVSHAMAISLIKRKYPLIKGISRTHRYDLYEIGNNRLSFRQYMGKMLDYIIPIAEDGESYLINNYKISQSKVKLFNLGSNGLSKEEFEKKNFSEVKFRLISVAFISERKRIDLIAKAIASLAKETRNINVEWIHIGDGDRDIKKQIDQIVSDMHNNFRCTFLGNLSNQEVLNFYKSNTDLDAFILVSSSEGKPVSIMEAQGFGIPVIASNVGGVSEIVDNENGILLSPDPSPKEVAQAISSLFEVDERKKKSQLSYQKWSSEYSAEKNYSKFSKFLVEL